jgi:type 2 lantibiotic biosynthesis protein LanM
MPERVPDSFEPSLGCLTEPALAGLAAQLRLVPGLANTEAEAVIEATRTVLTEAALRRTSRVLLLELNAARITGRLRAPDPAGRWREWLAGTTSLRFWESLSGPYPTLLPRLRTLLANRCAAALTLAARFSADRPAFAPGSLEQVTFGAGDSHYGGQTVAILATTAGRVLYKPRPVEVDDRVARLLDVVLPDDQADPARIDVPAVIARPGYGWSEYVEHRYCSGDAELSLFYRNIGRWLAVMRLLGGSDLHAENVIAAGPVPYIVDCEALFTPHDPYPPSGYGSAHDRAVQLIADSALRTGLLPGRGQALGWRGVDSSAVGALPGQQPSAIVPVIVGAGTDEARLGYESLPIPPGGNHPSPEPVLARHWDKVVAGFDELTARLHELDRAGKLDAPLAAFAGCRVRVVARPTETYMELGRMLWHPAALYDEPVAVKQAAELLAAHAANASIAPGDPEVILAEVAELLDGDVPVFETTPDTGRLLAPRGTAFGESRDLIAEALARWRGRDHQLDLRVVSDTLVSAYLNEGWQPAGPPMRVSQPPDGQAGLDLRRRRIAASIMRTVTEAAIRGEDGSATWIAPIISPTGWAVQPLSNDLYNGLSGVAVAAAGYRREVEHDRADPVPGLDELLSDLLRTMRMIETADEKLLAGETEMRPDAPGGYVGLGSLVWAWLLLARLGAPGVSEAEATERAKAAAAQLPAAIAQDEELDLFRGMAGAVVPLLRLAERSGDHAWLDLAGEIGDRLADRARRTGRFARWPNPQYPDGIGGAAHGATGIGWALARLSVLQPRHAELAEAAFAFEESLYDPARNGWDDLRDPGHVAGAWCHGGGGIAIVAADLMPADPGRWRDVLRRGAASAWEHGLGWNHTLCHGDLGLWEVMRNAFDAGVGPPDLTADDVVARVLGGLGEHGPVSGLARDALTPGLLPGLGGMAYQLLRLHPESDLPSVLLPGCL